MAGTIYSTGGFRKITRLLVPQVKIRFVGFILVVTAGIILLSWITRTIWSQLDRLQKEHAAVKSESFYLGVHLRGAIRSLNDKVLQYGVSRDPLLRSGFMEEAGELKAWIETNRFHLDQMVDVRLLRSLQVSRQLEILQQAELEYDTYFTNTLALVTNISSGVETDKVDFEALYRDVREISSSLFPLCDSLVKAQRQGFAEFLDETQRTLVAHQRLLQVCSALILGLAIALALLVYRGMIAPLRVGLSESQTIIERQEKLASLGILASGVAHEIRNPLTAIKFRLFSLRKALPAVAQHEDATIIGNEINRLERIVQDFLQFARPSEPRLARISAEQILLGVRDLFRVQLEKSAIELRMNIEESVQAYADPQQIKQVLINLVQNSAEVIGKNGTITLGLRRGSAELDGRVRPAAILSVSDTGRGITPEIEARLFDPFFTTKEGGTGLGLAISARIMEKHGGLLRYETEVNTGTTFEVVLPALENNGSEHHPD